MGIIIHCKEQKRLVLNVDMKPQYVEVVCDKCGKVIPCTDPYFEIAYEEGEMPHYHFNVICCADCKHALSDRSDSFRYFEVCKKYQKLDSRRCISDNVRYVCDAEPDENTEAIAKFIEFVEKIASEDFHIEIEETVDGEEVDDETELSWRA